MTLKINLKHFGFYSFLLCQRDFPQVVDSERTSCFEEDLFREHAQLKVMTSF